MKRNKTLPAVLSVIAILVIGYLITPFSSSNSLIISSDLHVSSPDGRWPHTTAQYRSLIDSLDQSPDIFFAVGDFVDNARRINGELSAGDKAYWRSEFAVYQSVNHKLDNAEFLHTYGPGHDFIGDVTLEYTEQYTGIPRRGVKSWGNVDLVWFTVYPGAFNNHGGNPPALEQNDYKWLDETLSTAANAILLWHVPIRTPATKHHGQWPGDTNLTIPHTDEIYELIDKQKGKILAIFNGHIHKPIKSLYNDIPVYLCPAYGTGCYCELKQFSDTVTVNPRDCGISGSTLRLKN
ncbi:MAG: 3',5'-cyclic adenosine monophosphate phosphodiesterase CpdA [Gammaproteobacteria bacterium]|nr:3',5'-cyclic adenosine monophosphate phosphodiesterase CpdA [Gammaproteobacteria bacterium]